VLQLKDKLDASFISYLRLYRLLQKAVISIDCAGASLCEVEKVEAAFRHAAEVHRNHPTIQLIRTNNDEMVSSSDHPDTEVAAWIDFFSVVINGNLSFDYITYHRRLFFLPKLQLDDDHLLCKLQLSN